MKPRFRIYFRSIVDFGHFTTMLFDTTPNVTYDNINYIFFVRIFSDGKEHERL